MEGWSTIASSTCLLRISCTFSWFHQLISCLSSFDVHKVLAITRPEKFGLVTADMNLYKKLMNEPMSSELVTSMWIALMARHMTRQLYFFFLPQPLDGSGPKVVQPWRKLGPVEYLYPLVNLPWADHKDELLPDGTRCTCPGSFSSETWLQWPSINVWAWSVHTLNLSELSSHVGAWTRTSVTGCWYGRMTGHFTSLGTSALLSSPVVISSFPLNLGLTRGYSECNRSYARRSTNASKAWMTTTYS